MNNELERLWMENQVLRDMVNDREIQIHSEWGVGTYEPSWEHEVEQGVCELKTGHEDRQFTEQYIRGELLEFYQTCASCGAFLRGATPAELELLRI